MPILMEKVCWGLGEDAARLLRIGCWALAAGCCGLRVAGCVRTCFVREMQDATGTGTGTGTVTLAGLGLDIPPSSFPLSLAEGGWGGCGLLPIGCGRLRPAAQTATCGVPTAAALGHRPGSEIAANRAASEMTSTFRHETGSSASCRPLTCGERECTSLYSRLCTRRIPRVTRPTNALQFYAELKPSSPPAWGDRCCAVDGCRQR